MNHFDKETKEERKERCRRKTEKYQRDLAKRRAAPKMYETLIRAELALKSFWPNALLLREIREVIEHAEGK